MEITIREYAENDLKQMIEVWNEVVNDGIAFPQKEPLDIDSAKDFFLLSHLQVLQKKKERY